MAVFGAAQGQSEPLCGGYVLTSDGEVGGAVECHLFGVAGTAHHQQAVVGHMEFIAHVVGDKHVLVGHDAFHGGDDEFLAYIDIKFFEMALEVGRRHDEHEGVGLLGHVVYV